MDAIRKPTIERDHQGAIRHLRVCFGPGYYVVLRREKGDHVRFFLGQTHHGVVASASHPGDELQQLVEELQDAHPELVENSGGGPHWRKQWEQESDVRSD